MIKSKAKWIWQAADGPANTWMCFRKSFELPAAASSAVASIAVDSKYWLWVNGRLVVREGGLRRGPTRTGTYVDRVDLAEYLRAGRNVLAVLVWYWGKEGFSHKDSGRGGLLLDLPIRAGSARPRVVSDGTWKTLAHPAFRPPKVEPNYRLPESCIRFDARKDIPGWTRRGFDERDWPAAVEKGAPGGTPWGDLHPRPVPFWKDYGLRSYVKVRHEGHEYTARLPYDAQVSTYLKVDAPAGQAIRMTADYAALGPVEWTYITADGVQEWEAPFWFNGEIVTYHVPPVVKVLKLAYRETGVDVEFSGSFRCDDERLNVLWEKARRTTYVCMRDNFMDCPDRERAQWWGDAVNEVFQVAYGFSPPAMQHVRKAMLEIARWQRPDGVLYSPVPSGNFNQELPGQMLAGCWVMWQIFLLSGDREAVEIVYPHVKRYLTEVWDRRFDEKGFVVPQGEWVWIDWGENKDGYRVANALYVMALDAAGKMATLLAKPDDAAELWARRDKVAKAMPTGLWTGESYGPDDRANALAVLAGVVQPKQREGVRHNLHTVFNASPYMERYVAEALVKLDDMAGALERLLRRYGPMIEAPGSTLWEVWSKQPQWSMNHAWAGGAMVILSGYVAGIRPIEPGFRRFTIAPDLGGLKEADCTVDSVAGAITASVRDTRRALTIVADVPAGTTAEVGLKKGFYPLFAVTLDGVTVRPFPAGTGRDERFVWIEVGAGRHTIEADRGRWE